MDKTCPSCGKVFAVKPSHAHRRKYCSRECKEREQTTKVALMCEGCGEEFHIAPSYLRKGNVRFCSRECYLENIQMTFVDRKLPERNTRVLTCAWCGVEFPFRGTNSLRAKNNYCSRSCIGKHRAVIYRGENNPRWRGGVSTHNEIARGCADYKAWRTGVFRRDYWTCQDCGVKSRNIRAHHIFQFADFPEHRFELWNGVTLCTACHRKAHAKATV